MGARAFFGVIWLVCDRMRQKNSFTVNVGSGGILHLPRWKDEMDMDVKLVPFGLSGEGGCMAGLCVIGGKALCTL